LKKKSSQKVWDSILIFKRATQSTQSPTVRKFAESGHPAGGSARQFHGQPMVFDCTALQLFAGGVVKGIFVLTFLSKS
jgi:hypothetical protein